MAINVSIDKLPTLKANIVAYDNRGDHGVAFISGFGYKSHMDEICKTLNLVDRNIQIGGRYFTTRPGNCYETIVTQPANSDYAHIVAFKKDSYIKPQGNNTTERIIGYVFHESEQPLGINIQNFSEHIVNHQLPQAVVDTFYDKLYKLCPLPIIKDWTYYLMERLEAHNDIYPIKVEHVVGTKTFLSAYVFDFSVQDLQQYITVGLQQGHIKIDEENNGVSETMRGISGLDAYLNEFREMLAQRIQESFIPRFTPDQDNYSTMLNELTQYGAYMGKLDLFNAQKDVVQAMCNALDKKRTALIIGEPGVGKTAMATSTLFAHNADKKIMTNVVMCPGHLVKKWKAEIERLAPLSDAVIVENFDHLMTLKPRIKDRHRNRHLWLVISKETAKFGYQERPAAVFSRAAGAKVGHPEGVFCCPECGQPLYTVSYEGRGRYRHEIRHYFGRDAFSKQNADNFVCMNKVMRYDKETGKEEEVKCGAKLWEAAGKYKKPCVKNGPEESIWVNLGKNVGWLMRDHIQDEIDRLSEIPQQMLRREERSRLFGLMKVVSEGIPTTPTPIKYPLGRYIRKYFKGYIDYAAIDEVHELKGKDSLQAMAFGDLVNTAKHSIAFTGTFLNGYSSGAYYILYRLFPGMMKEEGFKFSLSGENEFVHQYGVYKQDAVYMVQDGRRGNRQGALKEKELPGVSPLVFTKFLLENAVFISLEDIGEGLPGYEEIPVAVTMDDELREGYATLERDIHDSFGGRRGGKKTLAQMVQSLSVYPDCPYDQPPIVHPDTGEVLATPRSLSKDTVRNKDVELLRIVREKIDNGEKVLVYYNWVTRTDVGKRLPKFFKDNGISAVTMTSSVKNSERETWIKEHVVDKNVDVLIVNPSLVETGLDLLDFTTIIFYQVGYNLFTLRQASRRSWRLSQTHDVQVYFLYYQQTVQEQALNLMATKLQAAMAIEGKFTEDGLNAMSNNEDILTQIAASVADGIKDTVDAQVFSKAKVNSTKMEQKKDERMILIDRSIDVVPTALDAYRADKANKRKRARAAKALGVGERDLLGNLSQLFAAI